MLYESAVDALGHELQPPTPTAFLTKDSTEKIGEQLGLF